MRIISKYKDYYDYLAGVYGVDDKLVLDRRVDYNPANIDLYNIERLFICGKVIEFFVKDDVVYFGTDIEKLHEPKGLDCVRGVRKHAVYSIPDGPRYYTDVYYTNLQEDKFNLFPEMKRYYNKCPIFLQRSKDSILEFPKLDCLGLNKVIPAHDMWVMLTEWLGRQVTINEKPVPVGDDKVRLQAAGFDLKTSFRKM